MIAIRLRCTTAIESQMILTCVAWLGLSSDSLARLGETAAECIKRYGTPTQTHRGGMDTTQNPPCNAEPYMFFRMNGMLIRCGFAPGDAASTCDNITYFFGPSPDLGLVGRLMRLNSQGSEWAPNGEFGGDVMFLRKDGGRAAFNPESGSVAIFSKEWAEREQASIDDERKEKLRGF